MTGAVEETPQILLRHHLKKLKLPTVLREHEKLARKCASEGVDHVRYLARPIEMELLDREARMIDRRIKAAKFPAVKSLESFDFDAIPALNKTLVLNLARGEFVAHRGNVIALGRSGTGKTQCRAPLEDWCQAPRTSIFGDERLTGALLDRLTHVQILEMNGPSYRVAAAAPEDLPRNPESRRTALPGRRASPLASSPKAHAPRRGCSHRRRHGRLTGRILLRHTGKFCR